MNRWPQTRQHGFTLLEILISLGVVALILAVVFPALSGMVEFGKKEETQAQLDAAAAAITLAYGENAMKIDSYPFPELCLNPTCSSTIVNAASGAVEPSAVSTASADGVLTANALADIAQANGISVTKLDIDGFAKHFKYFVSNELQAATPGPGGGPIYYHIVAIVSSEGRSTLNAGTSFNQATGVLTLTAGNMGTVVSGLPIERNLMQQTLDSMQSLANIYSQFFTSRYLASANRDASIDYFSANDCPENCAGSALFDSTSPIGNSGNNHGGWGYAGTPYPGDPSSPYVNAGFVMQDCQPASALAGFQGTLGVASGSLLSAWGYPLMVCNGPNADGRYGISIDGSQDRNPASSTAALQTPPYTASIEAWSAWGNPMIITITGQY